MKKLIRYALVVFAVDLFEPLQAQISDSAGKWDIRDCINYAAQHNIQVSTLRLNEQVSVQDLSAAKAVKIPSLSASVGNTFVNAKNAASGNGDLVNQLTGSGNYTINSSVIVWNDHYSNNNIQQKELLIQTAGLLVKQSLNQITLLITQAYLDILLSKENLKYINDLVNTSDARVKQAQQLYEAGSIAQKDLLQLQAQLSGDKYLLVQIQNAIRQNILSLKQILQLPADTLFDIVTPAFVDAGAVVPSLKSVQQTALQEFPEIRIGELDVDIAALDIAKARAGFKPVVTVNGSLGTGYSDVIINSVSPKTGYFTQAGNNYYQRIGITLSIPVFSNRINKTNLEKANIALKQARFNLQNNRLVLEQEVEQAYLNVINAQQAYVAADQQLLYTTESYRIVNQQFRLGSVNTYDLLQQRNQYVQAVQAFTQARYSAVLQQKIYEFYMGKPITL